ncbi:MAG: hypothetical protein K0B14_17185 [Anaerolineaceae bacterium]|nr:hypothetical protein [Anaerolineaceae bacterium]
MESFHEAMMEEAANAVGGDPQGLSGHYGVYVGLEGLFASGVPRVQCVG